MNYLEFFCKGDLSFLPHLFTYSVICLYQNRLMNISFILCVIIQYCFIYFVFKIVTTLAFGRDDNTVSETISVWFPISCSKEPLVIVPWKSLLDHKLAVSEQIFRDIRNNNNFSKIHTNRHIAWKPHIYPSFCTAWPNLIRKTHKSFYSGKAHISTSCCLSGINTVVKLVSL
jgi:hypothetical protein